MKTSSLILNALRELGIRQLGLYAIYQLGLRTGYFRWAARPRQPTVQDRMSLDWLVLPERAMVEAIIGQDGVDQVCVQADEIAAGKARLFSSEPIPLQLVPPGLLGHWTEHDQGLVVNTDGGILDIKFVWEPARFGWAYTLGRAYYLSADERYPEIFWRYAELFLDKNPPYLGPNWASAQEAALRLVAFVFALRVFQDSLHTTPERVERLSTAIAAHAERIPPTLVYARAQNNNHLLTEAAGLYTAGLALPEHPEAHRWRTLGWRWFNRGVVDQVSSEGTYTQHSTNYQRLMLQTALWMNKLAKAHGLDLPDETRRCLGAATRWLEALLDPQSGRVPNLGPNDGAYILPLTVCDPPDYRPVLRAANIAFLDETATDLRPGDEMTLWLVDKDSGNGRSGSSTLPDFSAEAAMTPQSIRLESHPSWAYLRAARIDGRPGHADQLHLDLWWRGLNVAQDPGTYMYNAPPPWDNALTCTHVHNTLTVNGREQMQRAGRFLYLKRAQAVVISRERGEGGNWQRLVAQHNGYRRLGVIHQRSVTAYEMGRWKVEDKVLPAARRSAGIGKPIEICLHWLLPDWPWEVNEADWYRIVLRLSSPHGPVNLALSIDEEGGLDGDAPQFQLARAGECVYGSGDVDPTWGWSSPTYGDKIPALALRLTLRGLIPLSLYSEWRFPKT